MIISIVYSGFLMVLTDLYVTSWSPGFTWEKQVQVWNQFGIMFLTTRCPVLGLRNWKIQPKSCWPQPGSAFSLFLPSTSLDYGLAVPPFTTAWHRIPARLQLQPQSLPLLTPSLIPKKNKIVGSQSMHGCLKKCISGFKIWSDWIFLTHFDYHLSRPTIKWNFVLNFILKPIEWFWRKIMY